jgi:hypothetical protein
MFHIVGCEWWVETLILVGLGLVQIYSGLRRFSGMWIGVGVLLIVLPFVHLWAAYRVYQMHTGPVYGAPWTPEQASPGDRPPMIPIPSPFVSSSVAEADKPPVPPRKRSLGRDGWTGKYDDGHGVIVHLTIPPADSPRQREVAAPFAGLPKVGLVGVISVNDRSPNAVTIDTATAVLHLIDGTQTFAPNPWQTAAASDPKLSAFRPPYRVAAGGNLRLGILFLPADTDLASLDHVRLTLEGNWIDVR